MRREREMLDRAFSVYIRRRDCPDGEGRCISCGGPITFGTCDCGHYIPRIHTATRWNMRNCAAQCIACNRGKDGNPAGFARGLAERYGEGIIPELNALKHTVVKMTRSDYKELFEKYK